MADDKAKARVAKMRQARKAKGLRETNVWVPESVQTAIDAAVRSGSFSSRREAIIDALTKVYGPGETAAKSTR